MKISIILLVIAFIMFISAFVLFIKIKRVKDEILKQFSTISDDPKTFYDFYK